MSLRSVVRSAARTICVSEAEYFEVLENVGARSGDAVMLVRNGVQMPCALTEMERIAARSELGIPTGCCVGVMVGSLEAHKDPVTAARAARQAVQAGMAMILLVAGEGPLRATLAEVAAGARDPVRLLGHRLEVRQVLAAADFFVLPSHREGLSFALLEAMALGLPAVVSDAPGNPETVGEDGLVVRSGDVDGFATAFLRLAADAAERARLGERARARIERCFTEREMVRRTREIYEAVLLERAVPR